MPHVPELYSQTQFRVLISLTPQQGSKGLAINISVSLFPVTQRGRRRRTQCTFVLLMWLPHALHRLKPLASHDHTSFLFPLNRPLNLALSSSQLPF